MVSEQNYSLSFLDVFFQCTRHLLKFSLVWDNCIAANELITNLVAVLCASLLIRENKFNDVLQNYYYLLKLDPMNFKKVGKISTALRSEHNYILKKIFCSSAHVLLMHNSSLETFIKTNFAFALLQMNS